jgi:hypothetical protein
MKKSLKSFSKGRWNALFCKNQMKILFIVMGFHDFHLRATINSQITTLEQPLEYKELNKAEVK